MTPDQIHDLCIVNSLNYRTALNAAYAGYPSYAVPEEREQNERLLAVWEEIDRIRDWTALTTEQRALLNEAALR